MKVDKSNIVKEITAKFGKVQCEQIEREMNSLARQAGFENAAQVRNNPFYKWVTDYNERGDIYIQLVRIEGQLLANKPLRAYFNGQYIGDVIEVGGEKFN